MVLDGERRFRILLFNRAPPYASVWPTVMRAQSPIPINRRNCMNPTTLRFTLPVLSVFLLVTGATAFAQRSPSVHFGGVLNDYSPSTVKGGPWEMHGTWSLDLRRDSDKADFSAAMTMSGYGKTANGAVDPTQAGAGAHTHNIKLTHATITWNMSGCPAFSPVTLQGFQINGTVSLITGNGSNALFETTPPTTTLQVCVTGGDLVPYSVPYSNVTLVFDGPATSHFGTQAIHGVVRNVDFDHERR